MKPETTFWQRIGIHNWFLSDTGVISSEPKILTPNAIYKYIIDKFNESIAELSFADRVVFYHEYIICFNPEDYREFMDNKKGIFGLIVQETVKKFYEILTQSRTELRIVEPSSSKWVFRFVSHPDYTPGDKGIIGRLLPGGNQKEENLRVTFIPRQTGLAQTLDINQDILKGFTFYSEGYYEVPYVDDLALDEKKVRNAEQAGYARFETILPDKAYSGHKVEYYMNDQEIIVSGEEESRDESNIFKIQATIKESTRQYFATQDFTEFNSPKLLSGASEGGAEVFTLDYFGKEATLAQSAQFYKQIMVGVFERSYEIGSTYRAEPSATTRHMTEYLTIDAEMDLLIFRNYSAQSVDS